MFIVKKKIGGNEYYYLRKSVREKGKVVAKTVAYLGKDKKEAERKAREMEKELKEMELGKLLKPRSERKEMEEEKKEIIEQGMVKSTEIGIDDLGTFCKRKGFVYPSGELYGGLSGFWDYGVLGTKLKNNIKNEWRKFYIQGRDDMVEIDGSIITNPKVWEASGHVGSFVDIAVYDKKKKEKFKIDKHELPEYEKDERYEIRGEFNPMFTTDVGPVKADSLKSYLRPETAQLIFANFKQVWENNRLRLPCGIAQIGKAFRNEISPREFIFRNREFEQMEIEYFVKEGMECGYMDEIKDVEIEILSEEMQKSGNESGEKMKLYDAWKSGVIKTDWHAYFMGKSFEWFKSLGADGERFRVRQHTGEEKSHYASDTWDLEFKFPMGWRELQGFANRGNFDLTQHEKSSKKSLEVLDPKHGKVLPSVVCEPSLGVERAFLVFMLSAYEENKERGNTILHLNPKLAPIKAAIFPIVKNDEETVKMAREIYDSLKMEFEVIYDESGTVGKRYSRNDEAGTPYCITVDADSLKGKDCTVRNRDTKKQIRVLIKDLEEVLRKLIKGEIMFEKAGKLVD